MHSSNALTTTSVEMVIDVLRRSCTCLDVRVRLDCMDAAQRSEISDVMSET